MSERQKRIFINGRFLTQSITGVQRVAWEITRQLDVLDSKLYEFCILVPSSYQGKNPFKNIKLEKKGNLKGHLWEQISLPFFSRKKLLINFCNLAPIIKRQQIVYIHDAAIYDVPAGFSLRFKIGYRIIFSLLARQVRNVITVSYFSKKRLEKFLPKLAGKIKVSYLGHEHIQVLSTSRQQQISILNKYHLKSKQYILLVGSRNPNKNTELVIRVANNQKLSEYNFAIAGGNFSSFSGANNKATTKENINFLGYVEDEDLSVLYQNAKMLLFPSKYEGFGLPPMEAILSNTGVLASNLPVLKEVYKNKISYFNLNNDAESSLVNAILSFSISENRLVRNKRLIKEKYSWTTTANDLLNVIKGEKV